MKKSGKKIRKNKQRNALEKQKKTLLIAEEG